MSHNLAQEKREEYEARFGELYNSSLYPSPELTPSDRKALVASIKVCDAHARQIDMQYELKRLPKAGDAVILDKDHEHLPVDHGHQAEVIWIWSQHTKGAS